MSNAAWMPTVQDADPDHVMVYDGDAEPRRVAVTKRRQKWQLLRKVIEAMTWTRLEACDAHGGVLAVWPPERARAAAAAAAPPLPTEWQAPATALLAAYREGASASQAQAGTLINGYQGMLQMVFGSVADLRGLVTELSTMNRTLLRALADGTGGGGGGDDGEGGGDPGLLRLFSLISESKREKRTSEGPAPRPAPRPAPPRAAGGPRVVPDAAG